MAYALSAGSWGRRCCWWRWQADSPACGTSSLGRAVKIQDWRAQLALELNGTEAVSDMRAVSSVQRGFWFSEQVFPGTTFNNVCVAVELRGPLDTALAQE